MNQQFQLYEGECLEVMKTFEDNVYDSVICDPPYGYNFMSKNWDHGVPGVAYWAEALRVAKPGAFLLAFGGTRTWHRLAVAIEDAGWILRDTVMWMYGSGMPKALNISKAIDAHLGAERKIVGKRTDGRYAYDFCDNSGNVVNTRDVDKTIRRNDIGLVSAPSTDAAKEFDGWYSALKPSFEPIIVAMKPLESTFAANALKWNVAGLNVDGTRIEHNGRRSPGGADGKIHRTTQNVYGKATTGETFDTTQGRWPPNCILDESAAALLDEMSGELTTHPGVYKRDEGIRKDNGWGFKALPTGHTVSTGNTGGASRFFTVLPDESRWFYSGKASRAEREEGLDGLPEHDKANQYGDGLNSATKIRTDAQAQNGVDRGIARNNHPTVKNLSLMRWLVRLTKTPTGGHILDPFAGSGTTGVAAILEGRQCTMIEKEAEYCNIARHRLEHWQDEADMTPKKIKGKDSDYDAMPLFAEATL